MNFKLMPLKETQDCPDSYKAAIWDNETGLLAPEKSLGYQLILLEPCKVCSGTMNFLNYPNRVCGYCIDGFTTKIVLDQPCELCKGHQVMKFENGEDSCEDCDGSGGVSVEKIIQALKIEEPNSDDYPAWERAEYGTANAKFNEARSYLTYCEKILKTD